MLEYEANSIPEGLGCPCGRNPGKICNRARVSGSYSCLPCGGEISGRIQAESCEICTQIVDVRLVKTVHPDCLCGDSKALYTIAVRNCSSLPIQNVVVTDPEAVRLLRVGTIRINGVEVGATLRDGVIIPAMGPGSVAVITFQASPRQSCPAVIENIAYATYQFQTQCGGEEGQSASNPATLTILRPEIAITKEVDRCYVTPEEPVLTYTLRAENKGNASLRDVVVTDELPQRLDYVPGSTRIQNGPPQNLNPARGVNVGTLAAGQSVKVEFQAALDCDGGEPCDHIG